MFRSWDKSKNPACSLVMDAASTCLVENCADLPRAWVLVIRDVKRGNILPSQHFLPYSFSLAVVELEKASGIDYSQPASQLASKPARQPAS